MAPAGGFSMWAMSKRVFLFVLTNILIMVTLSITWQFVSRFFGLPPSGYEYLMFFAVVFGFGGAFISLFMSKFMAKQMLGVKTIQPNAADPNLRRVVERVHQFAKAAGLQKMPEVGIYGSAEVNAFATGPSRNNSLVAVSQGLLQRMDDAEVDGVLAHEVAHIANGDMVTMTLLQGIINAIVIFAARVIANIVANAISKDDRGPNPFVTFGIVIGLEILLSFLGAIVVNYFSRRREFRADLGGAKYAGRDKMISALRKLQNTQMLIEPEQAALQSLKIAGRKKSAMAMLFATHPALEDRIRALERANVL
jgi:heat shock protein HtpX